MASNLFSTVDIKSSNLTVVFSPVSLLTRTKTPCFKSRGPISIRIGTPCRKYGKTKWISSRNRNWIWKWHMALTDRKRWTRVIKWTVIDIQQCAQYRPSIPNDWTSSRGSNYLSSPPLTWRWRRWVSSRIRRTYRITCRDPRRTDSRTARTEPQPPAFKNGKSHKPRLRVQKTANLLSRELTTRKGNATKTGPGHPGANDWVFLWAFFTKTPQETRPRGGGARISLRHFINAPQPMTRTAVSPDSNGLTNYTHSPYNDHQSCFKSQ